MNSSAQRTKSNVLTVPSSEPVASLVSVGEKLHVQVQWWAELVSRRIIVVERGSSGVCPFL